MVSLNSLFPHIKKLNDMRISRIENDSRAVDGSTLFIAFTGFERDLHAFIPDAYMRGCRVFVVAQDYVAPQNYQDAVFIPSTNLKQENARLARLFYGSPDEKLCLICITGTNGKTTTASMIEHVLRCTGKKTAFFGTTHWQVGENSLPAPNTTPDLLNLFQLLARCVDEGITHVVMEAASHALSLGRMETLQVDVAAFTNLTQDHLDFHKNMDEYFLAKQYLFTNLLAQSSKKNKKAFINYDDAYGQQLATLLTVQGLPFDMLSLENKGTVNATAIRYSAEGVQFSVGEDKVCSSLIGRVNVQNALMACAVLKHLGLSSKDIAMHLVTLSVKGRMEKYIAPDGAVFLVDYAHTPDALERALVSAQSAKPEGGRLIVLFGAGGDRDKSKRPLMAKASLGADCIIVTSDNPRTEDPLLIIEDIKKGFPKDRQDITVEPDRRKALALARSLAGMQDVVLVAGKGHEEYQIMGSEKIYFSDIEEIHKLCP